MGLTEVAPIAELAARAVALAMVGFAGVTTLTHWAVRNRKLNPFGAWSRTVRSLSDPALRPIESRMVRRGANPQEAPLWLLGLAVAAGLVLITAVEWLFRLMWSLSAMAGAGPGTWARVVVGWAFGLVIAAIFVRFIAGWLAISPSRPWMRPVVWLTDWILVPVRRLIPPMGMVDLSPVVAYLALLFARALVFRVFFGG